MDHITELKNLMTAFQQKGDLSFKAFRDIWKQMNFSTIHQVFSDAAEPTEYIHACYYHLLGYLFGEGAPPIVELGVIYGIYLLYYTQTLVPKAKLTVTTTVWQPLRLAIEESHIKTRRLAEGYQCYRKMMDDGAIYFAAVLHPAAAKAGVTGEEPETDSNDASGGTDEIMFPHSSMSLVVYEGMDPNELARTAGVIDIQGIERVAGMYAAAKLGSLDTSGSAPPSLSLETDLPSELKSIFVSLHKAKEINNPQLARGPLFTTLAPPPL